MHQFGTLIALFVLTSWSTLTQNPPQSGGVEPVPQKIREADIKAGMHPPRVVIHPEAEYSPEALVKNIDGKCLISMIVDTNGMPQGVHVVRCTDRVFAQSSLAATRRYRFHPATTPEGKAIAAVMQVEIRFHLGGSRGIDYPVRYYMLSPPGVISATPDANGIYALSATITAPAIARYEDRGYGQLAFDSEGGNPCDVTLTIDGKGKPSDLVLVHCERDKLAEPATKSLLASKYKPGLLNGKPVSVRAVIHLEGGAFSN